MPASPVAIPTEPVPAEFAANGIEVVSDTAAHAVPCYAFVALTDCTIDALTTTKASGNTLVGLVIPAGHRLPLEFTSITLTSGTGYGLRIRPT